MTPIQRKLGENADVIMEGRDIRYSSFSKC